MPQLFKKALVALTTVTAVLTVFSVNAYAQRQLTPTARTSSYAASDSDINLNSVMIALGFTTTQQKDLNLVNDAHNYATSSNVRPLNSAQEVLLEYAHRFANSPLSIAIRPGYFQQGTDGDCGGVHCEYKLTGFTFFPMLRATPLENDYIKFYIQAGLGYGHLSTHVQQGDASADFSGDSLGGMAGLGANFCFSEKHCLTIEGDARYLPVSRNTADSVSGTFQNGSGFSQIQDKMEIEYSGSDLATSLSGIQGIIAYTYNF